MQAKIIYVLEDDIDEIIHLSEMIPISITLIIVNAWMIISIALGISFQIVPKSFGIFFVVLVIMLPFLINFYAKCKHLRKERLDAIKFRSVVHNV